MIGQLGQVHAIDLWIYFAGKGCTEETNKNEQASMQTTSQECSPRSSLVHREACPLDKEVPLDIPAGYLHGIYLAIGCLQLFVTLQFVFCQNPFDSSLRQKESSPLATHGYFQQGETKWVIALGIAPHPPGSVIFYTSVRISREYRNRSYLTLDG
jgi:hypothetical protein